ncbi:terminase [Brevibacillus sp. NRS-1366]|uniref:terminase n=1 Tax=Brevibacillus sp. NRS-1366 TaxID=3233899 RepID=UPI003D20A846
MKKSRSKDILSQRKIDLYEKNSKIIKFWRRNPVIACEQILGIKLLDAQKYILQESWTKPYVLWCCSRNFGKSFLGAIFMILKFLLFENQQIYIISSVGSQSQETFMKIEKIAKQRIESTKSLKDIFRTEVVTSPANQDGFTHNPASFHTMSYNGSEIFTLNGNPDNNRSKRATLVFFDEAGFSSDEIVLISEAFATQDSNFATSTDEGFNLDTQRKKNPTQLIYASSASDIDTIFFKRYKEFSKKMFLGDTRYFVADIPCDIPLSPLMDGEVHPPLLKKEQVENAMKGNREKANREYYNRFTTDGGDTQVFKRGVLVRNSTNQLPELFNATNKDKFILAFDPARSYDNSICSAMKIFQDPHVGWIGEIVNVVSMVDVEKKKRTPMKTPDQIKYFKNMLLNYNGKAPDYQNIMGVLFDSGAGGGGISAFADNLLDEWVDSNGIRHKGLIDLGHDEYKDYAHKYPNAVNKLKLISPKKYKKQMVEELKELLDLDLIKFTKEYDNKGFINLIIDNEKERSIKEKQLTIEEEIALTNIDYMKEETVAIHRFKSSNGNVSYDLPKDKESKIGDDRFYTLLMLGHFLYELRREGITNKKEDEIDWTSAPTFVSSVSF